MLLYYLLYRHRFILSMPQMWGQARLTNQSYMVVASVSCRTRRAIGRLMCILSVSKHPSKMHREWQLTNSRVSFENRAESARAYHHRCWSRVENNTILPGWEDSQPTTFGPWSTTATPYQSFCSTCSADGPTGWFRRQSRASHPCRKHSLFCNGVHQPGLGIKFRPFEIIPSIETRQTPEWQSEQSPSDKQWVPQYIRTSTSLWWYADRSYSSKVSHKNENTQHGGLFVSVPYQHCMAVGGSVESRKGEDCRYRYWGLTGNGNSIRFSEDQNW